MYSKTKNFGKVYYYSSYREIDKTLPFIYFIHGAAQDHSIWTQYVRYFSNKKFNAIAFDLPNHGKSPKQKINSVELFANFIKEYDELNNPQQNKIFLVGHSMGSLISLSSNFLIDHIAKSVLLGFKYPMTVSDFLLNESKNNPGKSHNIINEFSYSSSNIIGANINPGIYAFNNSLSLMNRDEKLPIHDDFTACNNFQINEKLFENLKGKFLLIGGAKDLMTPSKKLFSQFSNIENFKIKILKNVGHSMMSEAPNDILDLLIEFF